MFGKFNLGIMGTGNIAEIMAGTVDRMKGVRVYAVASRDQIRAEVFAGKHGAKKAYGSYEELAKDPKVDLIYIATPHSEHYDNALLCINEKKPILVEKSFTANAAQAKEVLDLAKEKGVFVTEAMWTRYMPLLSKIQEIIGSGIIGDITTLTCNLGYSIKDVPRLIEPALAGGALLDVGVYTLNFAFMLLGTGYNRMESSCLLTEKGVDEQNTVTLYYPEGRMATLVSSMNGMSDRKGIVYGTKGFAIVENINNFESITVYDAQYKKIAKYDAPKQITGYEYEVLAAQRAIENKEIECSEMPHAETLRIMKIMDELREKWGVIYPFEKEAN